MQRISSDDLQRQTDPQKALNKQDYRGRLTQMFPWLPKDFSLQTNPVSGVEDTDKLCQRIERVYRTHLTCSDPSYLRREAFRAIALVRSTKNGWQADYGSRNHRPQTVVHAFPQTAFPYSRP